MNKSFKFILSIFLITLFMLSISTISAADILNDTILENSDSDIVSEASKSDLIAVENVKEDIVSQCVDNDTVTATESDNETILGESETYYGSDWVETTTLTINGVKDYYYYGDVFKFTVYHSRYYNGQPQTTSVWVLVDNDVGSAYVNNNVGTGETITLYAGNLKLGLHTISTRYSDHVDNLDEVNFYVLKNPVKFSNPTKKVKKSKKVKTFKITAKLANGKPLSKKYVYMKIKGTVYKAKTTSEGRVTFKLLLPKKTKTYKYKVIYYGDYGYSAKTYGGKLKVR